MLTNLLTIVVLIYIGMIAYIVLDEYSYSRQISSRFMDILLWPLVVILYVFGVIIPDTLKGLWAMLRGKDDDH